MKHLQKEGIISSELYFEWDFTLETTSWPWSFNNLLFNVFFSLQNAARLAFQQVKKQTTQNLTTFDWSSQPEDLQRQKKFYSSLGNNLTTEKLEEMNKLGTEMESIYR